MTQYRDTLHLNPNCSVYDPDLTYALKPGSCEFSGAEFQTRLFINSAGQRDDEASLNAPEIIALGDSLTVGWGVNQEETYGQRLEKDLDQKVLVAGASSYGTVREMKLLERLDTSNLKTLILQYHPSDDTENRAYLDGGNELKIRPRDEFENDLARFKKRKDYFPGKLTLRILRIESYRILQKIKRKFAPTAAAGTGESNRAQAFLTALTHAGKKDLSQTRLIIIAIPGQNCDLSDFTRELQAEIEKSDFPRFIKEARILDMSRHLEPGHYYSLDDHPTAEGHQVIAGIIHKALREEKRSAG